MKILFSAALLFGAILAANAGQAVITAGPNDLTNNAGSTANFTVAATNATSYQWTFKGANIPGATNPQYMIEDTATNQAGIYSVIVGGSTGTNATASATLTVLQGTIINFQITGFRNGTNKTLLSSNVLVEMFDHDKPATVQNFIHYARSGAYLDMFFDRLIPGFVLQGGGWWALHQYPSNSVPPPAVGNIYNYFVQNFEVSSPTLPAQVAGEFYVGPQVSNVKGTLAMALPPGNPDGAANDFFFNLVDNTNLDTTNTGGGPFTVFGRVLSGTNVLDYFNDTNEFFKPSPTTSGTNGIYDEAYFDTNAIAFTDLPVNYHGTNTPANTNLFFVNLTFPNAKAQPLIDTNPPTAAITFPVVNSVVTNGAPLTVQGTAQAVMGNTARSLKGAVVKVPASEQGDAGLALTYCTVSAGGSDLVTVYATGTTNWSASFGVVPIGTYEILVTPQDGAGNQGALIIQKMIVSAVGTSGVGSVSASNNATGGFVSNAIGSALLQGSSYTLAALPGSGQSFLNWTIGTNVYTDPTVNVEMSSNLFVVANFTGRIAFDYPPLQGNTTNGDFSIQGGIYGQAGLPLTLTSRLFSFTNRDVPLKVMTTTGATGWSFPVTNLPLGHYFVEVTATDTALNSTLITNDFTAGVPFTILTNGNGRGAVTASFTTQKLVPGQTYYAAEGQTFSLKAAPASGSLFESWFDGSIYTNNPSYKFKIAPGLASPVATFVSNDFPATVSSPILFAYPASGARLTTQDFNLTGTLNPALTNPVVSYQLFYGSNSATPPGTNVTITHASRLTRPAWSVALSNLPPGYYEVVATVSDTNGRSSLISEKFQILAQVSLQIDPPGGGRLSSNWTGQYVPVGTTCTVTAKTNGGYVFAYWTNSFGVAENNPLKFTVTTNLSLTAQFASNYFFSGAGTYHGLFFPPPNVQAVTAANSGYYTLLVTSNGGVNLKLGFPAFTNIGGGNLGLYSDGTTQFQLAWADQVTNYVNLDLTNGFLSGYVEGPNFFANLQAFRAATKLTSNSAVIPGTNLFTIPGNHGAATNNQPGGDSYASFTLSSNGAVTVIGYLADNTPFSESTQVATNYLSTNGVWPFYASLYGGKGVILGWLTNSSPSNFFGPVLWNKPAKTGSFYTNGIEMLITNATSAPFVPPVNGSQYQIVFGGASLTNGFTNTLAFTVGGIFTNLPGGQAPNLLVTLNPKSGVLTGSFTPPSGLGTNKLFGAFTSPAVGGSGYFLDADSQTGFFQITAH